jgi:2'-5' RNA ligase
MRLFIASTFPGAAMASLNERVARVKPKLPPATWVRPEAQHLTFAFLGDQPETAVETLAALLTEKLQRLPAFEASLRGCGFFPNARNARVGWVGVHPPAQFEAVARAVREGVAAAGIALDRTDFKPHLTVMRIREHWPPLSIETFDKALRDLVSPPFRVERVTLYASQLQPSGAVHTALREFRLR